MLVSHYYRHRAVQQGTLQILLLSFMLLKIRHGRQNCIREWSLSLIIISSRLLHTVSSLWIDGPVDLASEASCRQDWKRGDTGQAWFLDVGGGEQDISLVTGLCTLGSSEWWCSLPPLVEVYNLIMGLSWFMPALHGHCSILKYDDYVCNVLLGHYFIYIPRRLHIKISSRKLILKKRRTMCIMQLINDVITNKAPLSQAVHL